MTCRGEPSPPNSGPGADQPTDSPTAPCTTCTVTLSASDLKICGAGSTGQITATGTPSGGTFSFSSSDTGVASVRNTAGTATITGVAQGRGVVITVTYTVATCTPCTATATVRVCTTTPGRKYAYMQKRATNLIGTKTKIKTRYAKLACEIEGCSTSAAFHAAYANISNSSSGLKWAQVGVSRRRNAGSSSIIQYRKAEVQGDNYVIDMDTANAPAEGAEHVWACDLDKSTGKWSFSQDGTVWRRYTDAFWSSHLGTVVQWVGEIYNREDDMPGTAGDKCAFTECQYRRDGGSYQDAGFTTSDPITSDAAEWGCEHVSATAFNIWDKNPNS